MDRFFKDSKSRDILDQKAIVYSLGGPFPSSIDKLEVELVSMNEVRIYPIPYDDNRLDFDR